MNIVDQLHHVLPQMSDKQQDVVAILLNDPYRSSFMSVRELAKVAHVSSATVLRLVKTLGFKHYKDMCRAFHESALIVASPMQKLKEGKISCSYKDPLFQQQVISYEKENLSVLLTQFLQAGFSSAIEILHSARNIQIIGARSSFSLAYYLGFLLKQFMANVIFHSPSVDSVFEELIHLNEKDVAIIFSFPIYTKSTLTICRFLQGRGVRIIAITDGASSPLLKYSSCSLFCPNTSPFYSYTASMSLCNLIILALKEVLGDGVTARLEDVGNILLEQNVYV